MGRIRGSPPAELDEQVGDPGRDADRPEAAGGLRGVLELGRAADLDQHAADRQQSPVQVEIDPTQAE